MTKVPYLVQVSSLLIAFATVQSDGDALAYTNASTGVAIPARPDVQTARPDAQTARPDAQVMRPDVQNDRSSERVEAFFAHSEGANAGMSEVSASRNVAAEPKLARTVPASIEPGECSKTERRRQIQGKIDPEVIRTASEQLDLPLGAGRYLSVGGQDYLFCLEMHYREPGSAPGPQGWHKGVTVFDAS
jgi:hypothetical protein